MRLPSNHFNRSLLILTVLSVGLFFACLVKITSKNTYAESEIVAQPSGNNYVTVFDQDKKLTFKTSASTVKEALKRAKIELGANDLVEPKLNTKIDADNFFINIYRAHPVILIDGATRRYLMVASFDPASIARAAKLDLYDGDRIELISSANFLEVGQASTYKITRNGGRTITQEEEIPFAEETKKDYTIGVGNTKELQVGELGRKTLVYQVSYQNGKEVKRELISETIVKQPVNRIVAVGANPIEMTPLTPGKGRNRYTINGVERQETFYDLPMASVMRHCGGNGTYTVRADGAKVDQNGLVIVAAHLGRYPRCSVVQTSLGQGKVYDTGGFAASNPEQFDLATDWSNRDGI